MQIEDKSICSKCGGFCCKKSGCDYFVSDFENFKFDYLDEFLSSGNISIVAALDIKYAKNGKLMIVPFLYLRARNINRDIVDLFSYKTTCSLLTENGCIYDLNNRPSGGSQLVPSENYPYGCYSQVDKNKEILKWQPYQKVLRKLVKKYSGKIVEEKLSDDVKKFFYQNLIQDYDGISPLEIMDANSALPYLKVYFNKEYNEVLKEYSNSKMLIRKK